MAAKNFSNIRGRSCRASTEETKQTTTKKRVLNEINIKAPNKSGKSAVFVGKALLNYNYVTMLNYYFKHLRPPEITNMFSPLGYLTTVAKLSIAQV